MLQVDLFFYRDPEEAKEAEEEEAPVAPDFGAIVPNDQWTTEQWIPDAGAAVIPPVPAVEWSAQGLISVPLNLDTFCCSSTKYIIKIYYLC